MAKPIELQFLTNAKQIRGELYQMNAELRNIRDGVMAMNTKGAAGAKKHSSAMKGLAMRFVGYNLVLNQVMGAQQKVLEYVKESITKYREFQTRIAEISTIMGTDFQDSIYGLKAGVESLSLSFGKNTSDMSKGLYDIMSAAFSAKDAIALLGTATKAAIAGLADVRESVDIFTTVLNTYGMSAYEATWVSDMLFQSVVRGKFQFKDLETALGYVVPIAAQAGIAFDELMAALSTTTRHGLHLDMTSRGLAMAIQNIIKPSEGAKKAAEKYGVELNGLMLRVKGLTGFFKQLNQKTKEYGKIILTELIPNIRSLRTVMVLAGEEGLEGLIDDMDRLSMASGRTEEALSKIMDTSAFVSNQIKQEWEQTQRDVGKAWDEMALGIQGALVDVAGHWYHFLPVIGAIFTGLAAGPEIEYQEWLKSKQIEYRVKPGYIRRDYPTEVMEYYLKLQEEIATKSREVSTQAIRGEDYSEAYRQLLALNDISVTLQEDFNRAFGEPILGGVRNLKDLHVTLQEIEFDIIRLKKELIEEVTWGWSAQGKGAVAGTLNYQYQLLEAEQLHVDIQHDIKMGLVDETYGYKMLNEEMKEAIRIVREHERVQKSNRQEMYKFNEAMRVLQLQAAQIQLKGMLRRRGQTRAEQRMLKRIQIEQLKLRIENMESLEHETTKENALYLEKKDMLEKYQRDAAEVVYQMKYTYTDQLKDLDSHIKSEKEKLEERGVWWQETSDEIAIVSENLMASLEEIFSDTRLVALFSNFDISISDLLEKVKELQGIEGEAIGGIGGTPQHDARGYPIPDWKWGNYARGIQYVPETMPAIVHQGEHILPSGQNIDSGISIDNVIIQVKEVSDIDSIEKLGALLSQAESSGVMKRGKTNYKLRIG